jgi:3(or 17)beta-hydroxysteroid dehydrogenase
MSTLDGKVALITGGTSGIGKATALLFSARGAKILVTGRDHERGNAVVADIAARGGQALFLEQDVTVEQRWSEIVQAAIAHFGRLDIVFNNAGVSFTKSLSELTLQDWRLMMAVNVDGTFLGTKYCVQTMRRVGNGGSIINNASVYGLIAAPDESAYCAAKGAVVMFSRAVALECARERDGIRVNCVCAGSTWTSIFVRDKTGVIPPNWSEAYAGLRRAMAKDIPLGSVAAPEQIAKCVLFLASEDSNYMTGAELTADGGVSAGLRGPLLSHPSSSLTSRRLSE